MLAITKHECVCVIEEVHMCISTQVLWHIKVKSIINEESQYSKGAWKRSKLVNKGKFIC